jgi:hypothetical protein
VNITRITKAWLAECGLSEYEPASLSSPRVRDGFALDFAPVHAKLAHGPIRRHQVRSRDQEAGPPGPADR